MAEEVEGVWRLGPMGLSGFCTSQAEVHGDFVPDSIFKNVCIAYGLEIWD